MAKEELMSVPSQSVSQSVSPQSGHSRQLVRLISGLAGLNTKIQILHVHEVVTQPKILNRTILSNLIHVT